MFSLNVPLPGAVRREIETLRPALADFETVREEPTLVVKRFGSPDAETIETEARFVLDGAVPFDVRIDGVDMFEQPVTGPAPVLYVAIESAGLNALHDELVEAFGAEPDLEGPDYVPHITVARGGDGGVGEPVDGIELPPFEWTVTELWFWNARENDHVGTISLGA